MLKTIHTYVLLIILYLNVVDARETNLIVTKLNVKRDVTIWQSPASNITCLESLRTKIIDDDDVHAKELAPCIKYGCFQVDDVLK